MAIQSLYQAYSDYILFDAVWSSTVSPLTTYSVTQLAYLRPDWRIKWGVTTVTITATLGGSRQGDLVVVPISNLDAAVLTVTNGAGLNQPITLNTPGSGNWPETSWIDLTRSDLNGGLGWSVGQRTSSVWNFVIAGNSKNITLGSALWISGPRRALPFSLAKGADLDRTYAKASKPNEYLVEFVLDLQSRQQTLSASTEVTSETDRAAVATWIDGSHGASLPSVFVRDTTINRALLCYAMSPYREHRVSPTAYTIPIALRELAKGIPLL